MVKGKMISHLSRRQAAALALTTMFLSKILKSIIWFSTSIHQIEALNVIAVLNSGVAFAGEGI